MEKAAGQVAGAALNERLQFVTGEVQPQRPAVVRPPCPEVISGLRERVKQFIKFCFVGGSGVFVDMGALYLLADPRTLALNLALSKICAAETALINNFIWNEAWTFKRVAAGDRKTRAVLRRLLFFNAICGVGIILAVLLLHLFHTLLRWDVYFSNLLAIGVVTVWNFGLNARFNWGRTQITRVRPQVLFTGLFFVLLNGIADRAHAEHILSIYGTLEFQLAELGTNAKAAIATSSTIKQWTNTFHVMAARDRWEIEGDFVRNSTNVWWCDGTNVYESSYLTSVVPETIRAADATNRQAVAEKILAQAKTNLTISVSTSEGYPIANVRVNILWLAFCSSGFLDRPGRIIPLPVADIGHAPDVLAYRDVTERFSDDLGLPRKVELFTSASLYSQSASNFWRGTRFQRNRYVPLFGDDLRKFQYAVNESTNTFGGRVPVLFTFAEELPHYIGNFGSTFRGTGRVSEIAAAESINGGFNTSLHQTVVDNRFRHPVKAVNQIVYPWTNGFPPQTNDPELRARFARIAQRAPYKEYIRARRARLTAAVLTFVTAIPLLALLSKKIRSDWHNKHNIPNR